MRILLCTDGSAYGQAALRYGVLLARPSSEPATLLGVSEEPRDRARLERALEEGKQWLSGAPEPQIEVRVGRAADEILAKTGRDEYDLVVLGARGRRGITRFLLGSTAEWIARHARLPVLIVRGERETIDRILLCTGGREPGMEAVRFGGRVARLVGAEATVLHVMSQVAATPLVPHAGMFRVMPQTPAPSEVQLEDLERSAEQLIAEETREGLHLQQALDVLADLGVPAKPLVRHGLVVDEVEAEACEGDYDLLVVGAHAVGGWMRLLLKDVGQQILGCCTDRPVLIAKPAK